MTKTMRAAARPDGPRVLRVGLVRGGKVVDELLSKARGTLTIGAAGEATFVVDCAKHELFVADERAPGAYVLRLGPGMHARIATAAGIVERGPGTSMSLDLDARGKVVVGAATLLFQFVLAPHPVSRPQLPLSVRSGPADIDWNLTILAALSFLFHFGFVGALYSDWIDPVVGDVFTHGPIDLVKALPTNLPVETPTVDPRLPTEQPAPSKTSQVSQAGRESGRSGAPQPGKSAADRTAANEAALLASAERMTMEILAATNAPTAMKGALERGNVPVVDVGREAAKDTGVTGGEVATRSTGPLAAGKPSSLDTLGSTRAGHSGDAGKQREPLGPVFDTATRVQYTTPVSDADRVVAGLRPSFRRCYQNGLTHDASMSGRVVVTAKIAPNGEVSSAVPTANTGLSADVASCVARAVRGAQFSAPGPSGSTLTIPVSFVQQGK